MITPQLLSEGGCMQQLRRNIKKNWADKINNNEVDAYTNGDKLAIQKMVNN